MRRIYQRELVGHPAVRGQFGSEAQRGEHLIAVIVLNDLAHRLQRHGVGVHLIRVHIVQRRGLGRVALEYKSREDLMKDELF